MDKKILQSIVKITEQCDAEALDQGLVVELANNLDVKTISLYKTEGGMMLNCLEKTICVTIQDNKVQCHRTKSINVSSDYRHLEMCVFAREIVKYQDNNGYICYAYPLISGDRIFGVVEICSHIDLCNANELVSYLIRIYANCLAHIHKSERDKLTGLLNRHSFDTKFRRLVQTQQIKQQEAFKNGTVNEKRKLTEDSCAWLAIFDIDHFKRVNDKYGHVCGDEVLLMLSQKMKEFFRSTDLLFRFGGEEFVIILEPIPYEMAKRTLERFRKKIEDSVFPLVNRITTSGGYIKITDSDYPTVFIERADQALYFAKKNGRNNICNYESLVECGAVPEPKEVGAVDLF